MKKLSVVCLLALLGIGVSRAQTTTALAESKTARLARLFWPPISPTALLDAMKHRRTYASLDGNIQCQYTVNGQIMGSTLNGPGIFKFEISITAPNTNKPGDKITKIDIVKDRGMVVETDDPSPAYSVRWRLGIKDTSSKYFFVRVWSAGGGDTANPNPAQPVAWLAPVWTGK